VGAGTVLNPQQLAEVTEAGAQFAISPGLTEPLLKAATAGTIPMFLSLSFVLRKIFISLSQQGRMTSILISHFLKRYFIVKRKMA
ncbi:hypothetical protein MJM83_30490, partial [Salmonella enterica subsp. enterica serovar Montevideo]|nr:hypothetical protein [Salmonella enterica subsp. enterica serovar Montevideo]